MKVSESLCVPVCVHVISAEKSSIGVCGVCMYKNREMQKEGKVR